jgi:hypothetical protein
MRNNSDALQKSVNANTPSMTAGKALSSFAAAGAS